MGESLPSVLDLTELEAVVTEALRTRDDSTLSVLGYGEVSVALGWPIDSPQFVCKRTPPFTTDEFAEYNQLVTDYIANIEAGGLAVADTTIVPLGRGDLTIAYLVQPKLDAESLGANILRSAEPDPVHPFVVAVAESLEIVSPTLSIDAQFTNFSWDGSNLTLVDIGTPFIWNESGEMKLDMIPFARMLPAPTRRLAVREMTKLVDRWNDPRRVGLDIVANLYREGLTEWVEPTLLALNKSLGHGAKLTAEEARSFYEEDAKTWPMLKRLQAAERWWRTSIRRRPYDWFIYSTFE